MLLFWALILLHLKCFGCSEDWSYSGSKGPSNWPGVCLTGQRQSPVEIETPEIKRLSAIQFYGYEDLPASTFLLNSGHTAKINFRNPSGDSPHIRGGELCPTDENCTFVFAEVHFHWGSKSDLGSEHTINGKSFPLEAHLVHYNQKYKDLATAVNQPDGLAVLGVLFHLQPEDNPKWRPLTRAMKALARMPNEKWIVGLRKPLRVSAFLPKNRSVFYRYHGSLTNPGCYESVVWTIFVESEGISENQLLVFRSQINKHDQPMVDNFRPPQPGNGRVVYFSIASNTTSTSVGRTPMTSTVTLTDSTWCQNASAFIDRAACLDHLITLCPATCHHIIVASYLNS